MAQNRESREKVKEIHLTSFHRWETEGQNNCRTSNSDP